VVLSWGKYNLICRSHQKYPKTMKLIPRQSILLLFPCWQRALTCRNRHPVAAPVQVASSNADADRSQLDNIVGRQARLPNVALTDRLLYEFLWVTSRRKRQAWLAARLISIWAKTRAIRVWQGVRRS